VNRNWELPNFLSISHQNAVAFHLPSRSQVFMTQILVVTAQATTSDPVVNLLKTQGYGVTSACGFQAAVAALNVLAPEFLVSDLRLGAFNALHLAIRHRQDHPRMQTILVDSVHDAEIEREAARQGAQYLVEPIDASELFNRISNKLANDGQPRRWRRKAPADALFMDAAGHDARIVDASDGGVRLEVAEGIELPPMFDLCSPEQPFLNVGVKSIWTRPASRGWVWCGGEICDRDPHRVSSWRRFVDQLRET
jgi:CheY-like chemotaxis protein